MGSRLVVVEAFLGDLEAWFLTCNNPGGLSTRDKLRRIANKIQFIYKLFGVCDMGQESVPSTKASSPHLTHSQF